MEIEYPVTPALAGVTLPHLIRSANTYLCIPVWRRDERSRTWSGASGYHPEVREQIAEAFRAAGWRVYVALDGDIVFST